MWPGGAVFDQIIHNSEPSERFKTEMLEVGSTPLVEACSGGMRLHCLFPDIVRCDWCNGVLLLDENVVMVFVEELCNEIADISAVSIKARLPSFDEYRVYFFRVRSNAIGHRGVVWWSSSVRDLISMFVSYAPVGFSGVFVVGELLLALLGINVASFLFKYVRSSALSADFGFQSRNVDLHVFRWVTYVVEVVIPNAGVGVLDVLYGLYSGGVYSVHLISLVLSEAFIGVKYLDSVGDLCKARYVFRDSVKFSVCGAVE